jgi:hypothetical protein
VQHGQQISMDHLCGIHFQVNQCQPVVVHAHTIRVFDPLTLKDGYLQSCAVIEFSYVLYVPIVRGFHS